MTSVGAEMCPEALGRLEKGNINAINAMERAGLQLPAGIPWHRWDVRAKAAPTGKAPARKSGKDLAIPAGHWQPQGGMAMDCPSWMFHGQLECPSSLMPSGRLPEGRCCLEIENIPVFIPPEG